MILLPCPWCGPRSVSEFRYCGELRDRPDPVAASAEAWRRYLYFPANPCGPTSETWYHRAGCRQYFTRRRDTATNEIDS